VNVKLSFIVGEEAVGLVSSVVLGAESPVNVWKYGLLFEVYCAEDTAAYFRSLLPLLRSREERGLSAFSTFLSKKHGKRDFSSAISPFLQPCFAVIVRIVKRFN
jgi:hypothetical protein